MAKYRVFTIHEPKTRVIMALPFRDRVVQHALCRVIRPVLEKHFISGNAANRDGKGTHYAIDLLSRQMRRLHFGKSTAKEGRGEDNHNPTPKSVFCLKGDIAGFFYNMDREILKKKLRRLFLEPGLRWLIELIIDSSPDLTDLESGTIKAGKGLPIGNLTSQFFAIYYLSDFDHFVKEKLRIKNYIRYMDDFTLLHHDRQYLRQCLVEIKDYLTKESLELNRKTQIFSLRQGIDFLGWRFYITKTGKVIRLLRRESKIKRRRQSRAWMEAYQNAQKFTEQQAIYRQGRQSLFSWLGHIKYGHTHHLKKRFLAELKLKNLKSSSRPQNKPESIPKT